MTSCEVSGMGSTGGSWRKLSGIKQAVVDETKLTFDRHIPYVEHRPELNGVNTGHLVKCNSVQCDIPYELKGVDHRRHQHVPYEIAGSNYELRGGSSRPEGKMVDVPMSYDLPYELSSAKARAVETRAFGAGERQGSPFTGKST